ncbi:MAG: YHS domain-containing protein [Acidobacteriota bacterium]
MSGQSAVTTKSLDDEAFWPSPSKGDRRMATYTDPVCGMKVDDQKSAVQSTHQGKTYYFCSESCKTKFEQDPKKYASQ